MPSPSLVHNLDRLICHLRTTAATHSNKTTATPYCKYLPVTVHGCATSALIDSGNLWRNVMSEEFFRQLQKKDASISLTPLSTTKVGTAKKSAALQVLGESTNSLKLHLAGLPMAFRFKPVILRGLAMPLNLSGPFLKKHNIDQLHSQNALRVQDQLLPLSSTANHTPPTPEAAFSDVYLIDDVTVPPMSIAHINVLVSEVVNEQMPPGDGILTGGVLPETRTDSDADDALLGWSGALVTCRPDGSTVAGLINATSSEITLNKGRKYGTFIRTCSPTEADTAPWRICVMEGPRDKGPTLRQKLRDAIAKAKEKKTKKQTTQEEPSHWSRKKKRTWLTEQFKLSTAPCLKSQTEIDKALDLLEEFFDVISANGEYGHTKLMKHEIHTEDVPPIKCRHHPLNPSLEPDLRAQLDTWLDHDIVEPSNSPWSFPLVAAPKKNGSIRWCVDYRRLNNITRKDTFPLPNIEDNLARLSKSKIFSCVDGSGAFHVIEIRDQDRPKTAFSTPWGMFHYKRMPFGLTNGPASYSRLVQLVLHGIPQQAALPYLDDTIIHSRDLDEHFRNLRLVLLAHRKAGLKLQPSKCQLFQDKADYLGYRVSATGVSPQPDYVKLVADWPIPTNKTEARVFLGKVGYYRRFIRNYSKIARPWTDVTGKVEGESDKQPLEVTAKMRASFQELKSHLCKAPILAYPQFDSPEPFILDTDWSQDANAIGAVLSQEQDGKERVILYGAKKMNQSQSNYAPVKGELAAVLYFAKKWRYYLQHRPFILRVDHLPLKFMKTMEPPDNHVARMLTFLANFQFEVQHRAGTKHGNADALSRAPHVAAATTAKEMIGTDEEMDPTVSGLSALVLMDEENQPLKADPGWLREQQEQDEVLRDVRDWYYQGKRAKLDLRQHSPEARSYAHLLDQLFMDQDGVLRLQPPSPDGLIRRPAVVCLPFDLWRQVIGWVHEKGGHMGIDTTLYRLQERFYFPNMRREVADYIRGCLACQQKLRQLAPQRGTLASVVDGYPFQRLAIDFVGPLNRSRQGHEYILTARDTFSRWLEAYPVRKANAATVARVLEKEIFCRFGFPDIIHSDQGSQFTSSLFKELTEALGILATTTPAYNPKSNPVERAHRDLGNALRAIMLEQECSWEDALPAALFALNTARCASTGIPPYQLLFGRHPSTPIDLVFGAPPQPDKADGSSYSEYVQRLRDRIQIANRFARDHMREAILRQRRYYNKDEKLFKPGQAVWLFSPASKPGESRKFANHWTGPWTVVGAISDTMYRIIPQPDWQLKYQSLAVSVDRLKLYHAPLDTPQVVPSEHHQLLQTDQDATSHGQDVPDHLPGCFGGQVALPAGAAPAGPPPPPGPGPGAGGGGGPPPGGGGGGGGGGGPGGGPAGGGAIGPPAPALPNLPPQPPPPAPPAPPAPPQPPPPLPPAGGQQGQPLPRPGPADGPREAVLQPHHALPATAQPAGQADDRPVEPRPGPSGLLRPPRLILPRSQSSDSSSVSTPPPILRRRSRSRSPVYRLRPLPPQAISPNTAFRARAQALQTPHPPHLQESGTTSTPLSPTTHRRHITPPPRSPIPHPHLPRRSTSAAPRDGRPFYRGDTHGKRRESPESGPTFDTTFVRGHGRGHGRGVARQLVRESRLAATRARAAIRTQVGPRRGSHGRLATEREQQPGAAPTRGTVGPHTGAVPRRPTARTTRGGASAQTTAPVPRPGTAPPRRSSRMRQPSTRYPEEEWVDPGRLTLQPPSSWGTRGSPTRRERVRQATGRGMPVAKPRWR